MKAIIEVNVPDYQIGQEVSIYFKDTMMIKGIVQEPCDDAISRQAVLSKKIYTETENGWSGYTVDADYIENLPSVTPTQKNTLENTLENTLGDAISREAVLKGIEELKRSPWATDKRGNGFEYLIAEALDVAVDLCVKQAPSVKPQICNDAVSRDAVKELIRSGVSTDTYDDVEQVCKWIDALPSVTQKPIECDDAISREDAIAEINDTISGYIPFLDRRTAKIPLELNKAIMRVPPVTEKSNKYRKEAKRWKRKWLKSQKSGKWISSPHIYAVAFCSECGYELEINNTNYCPSCGADMRGNAE